MTSLDRAACVFALAFLLRSVDRMSVLSPYGVGVQLYEAGAPAVTCALQATAQRAAGYELRPLQGGMRN
jgi:hypothetical protein